MTKQNLFTEEELAKVTDEAERKHLIECAQDQSTRTHRQRSAGQQQTEQAGRSFHGAEET